MVDAPQLGVGGGGAAEVVQRVGPPQDLLDGTVDERRVGAQLGQLLRVLQQREQPGGQHRLGGVVAGRHELHEERAEVDVGHELPAELGAEDQRGEVVARLLLAPAAGELDGVHRHRHDGVDDLAAGVLEVGVLVRGAHLGPAVDLGPVLLGDADELADHLRRQAAR